MKADDTAQSRRVGRPPKTNARDAVLDAAEQLIARLGYSRMTMDDIARDAGVGRATLYHLFPGKEAIALAATDRRHESLLAAVRQAAQDESVSPSECLRNMMRVRVLSAFDRVREGGPPDYDMLAAIRADYMERRLVYMENEARLFQEVLLLGFQTGELTLPDNPAHVALALVQATNALMPFSLSARQLQSGREEVAQQIEVIAALLLDGLRMRDHRG